MYQLIVDFFTGPGNCILALPPLLLAALIGAGAGVVKNKSEQDQADKQRKYESETARWSPWTGMTSKYVKDPSLAGNVVGGAASGMAFGQGLGKGGTSVEGAVPATSGVGPVSSGSTYGAMLNNEMPMMQGAPSQNTPGMSEDMFGSDGQFVAKDKKGFTGYWNK